MADFDLQENSNYHTLHNSNIFIKKSVPIVKKRRIWEVHITNIPMGNNFLFPRFTI